MFARIFRPAKTTMQSGRARTKEWVLEFEPASLKVAVLCRKLHDRCAPGAFAEYVGLEVEDRYVFGCGMDYKEWWRQLPGIWAVRGL